MLDRLDDLIQEFVCLLRNCNHFDDDIYNEIIDILKQFSTEWKNHDKIPKKFLVCMTDLIDQLAGGSRFFDEKTAIKVEDANIEIMEFIFDNFK